ncbi:unnamed protein product [Closterium sp. NIES-53]
MLSHYGDIPLRVRTPENVGQSLREAFQLVVRLHDRTECGKLPLCGLEVESRQLVAEEFAASQKLLTALLLPLCLDLRPLFGPKQLRRPQLPQIIKPLVEIVHAIAGETAAQLHALLVSAPHLVPRELPLVHGVQMVHWASLPIHASHTDLLASTMPVQLQKADQPALALATKLLVGIQIPLSQIRRGGLDGLRNLRHINL